MTSLSTFPCGQGVYLLDLPAFRQMSSDDRNQLLEEVISLSKAIKNPATMGQDANNFLALVRVSAEGGGDAKTDYYEWEDKPEPKYPRLVSILQDADASLCGSSPFDVVLERPFFEAPTTLLLYSALHANVDCVSLLLSRGADAKFAPVAYVNPQELGDSVGPLHNPLHATVKGAMLNPEREKEYLRVWDELIKKGADPSACDSEGCRPLDLLKDMASTSRLKEITGVIKACTLNVDTAEGVEDEVDIPYHEDKLDAASNEEVMPAQGSTNYSTDTSLLAHDETKPSRQSRKRKETPLKEVIKNEKGEPCFPYGASKQGAAIVEEVIPGQDPKSHFVDSSILECTAALGRNVTNQPLQQSPEKQPIGLGPSITQEQRGMKGSKVDGNELELQVMTWNVLASCHTRWNTSAHGQSRTETHEQRCRRHDAIMNRIRKEAPDVILLQEVDDFFIPVSRQEYPKSLDRGESLGGYTPYLSYGRTRDGTYEGVAILLKDGVWELDQSLPHLALEKGENTGWKSGLVIHGRHRNTGMVCCFASVHLPWGKDEAKATLLQTCLDVWSKPGVPVVLGGDFNTDISKLEGTSFEATLREGGLRRMPIASGVATGMGGCPWERKGTEVIDHLYCTGDLEFTAGTDSCNVGKLPLPPKGPWANEDNDGSDHAWILAALVCRKTHQSQPLGNVHKQSDHQTELEQTVADGPPHMPTNAAHLTGGNATNTNVKVREHAKTAHPSFGNYERWYWETDDKSSWEPFNDEANKKLEQAYCAQKTNVVLKVGEAKYFVDFVTFKQKNVDTNTPRNIHRGWPGLDSTHCEDEALYKQQHEGGTIKHHRTIGTVANFPGNHHWNTNSNQKGEKIAQSKSTRTKVGDRAQTSFLKGVLDERAIDNMYQMAQTLQTGIAVLFTENTASDKNKKDSRLKAKEGLFKSKKSAPLSRICSFLGVSENHQSQKEKILQEPRTKPKPQLRFKPRTRDSLYVTMFFGGKVLCALPPYDIVEWHDKLVKLLESGLDSQKLATCVGKSGARCTTSGGNRDAYTMKFRRLELFPPHRRNLVVASFGPSLALQCLYQGLRKIALESRSDLLKSLVEKSDPNLAFHVTIGEIVGGSDAAVQELEQKLGEGLGRKGIIITGNDEVEFVDFASCAETITFEAQVCGLEMGGIVPPQVPLDWDFPFETRVEK